MTVHDELNVNFSFHRNCWNPLHGYQRNRDLREKKKKFGHFPILAGSHELRNTLDLTAPIHAITSALPLNFPCLFIYEG